MARTFIVLLLCLLMGWQTTLLAASPNSPAQGPQEFWAWFAQQSDAYYHFENDQEQLFDALAGKLSDINEYLTFEFGPVREDGKREFVISADGIIDAFPAVTELVAKAPKLKQWDIIAFRQRKPAAFNTLEMGEAKVKDEDVLFLFVEDDDKIAVRVFIKGYQELTEWKMLGYIILDQVIGEWDTEMMLSGIDFQPLKENDRKKLLPITKLPEIVDAHRKSN